MITEMWNRLPTDSHKVLALVSANVSLQGFGMFITKITPFLSAGVYIVQIVVGVVTVWHVLKTMHKKPEAPDED